MDGRRIYGTLNPMGLTAVNAIDVDEEDHTLSVKKKSAKSDKNFDRLKILNPLFSIVIIGN